MAHSVLSIKEVLESIMMEQPLKSKFTLDNCIDLHPKTVNFLRYIFRILCETFNRQLSFSYKEHTGLPENSDLYSHRSYYFPSRIQDFISDTESMTYQYKLKIRSRDVTVDLVCFRGDNHNHRKMISLIYSWLYLVTYRISPTCSKSLHILLFLTDFEKKLPTKDSRLTSNNVNSAFTTSCDIDTTIVIYRKEEWFKVLIHESFHCLGLDFSHRDFDHTPFLDVNFHFENVNYKVFETYCETWARIMNICFSAFTNLPRYPMQYNDVHFLEYCTQFSYYMFYENLFSAMQMYKILRHHDIRYLDIINEKNKDDRPILSNYKESTSVLSYYVFTCVLMNNFQKYIEWCTNHHKVGSNIFQFDDTNANIESFCLLISSCSKCDHVIDLQSLFSQINNINTILKHEHDTLMMSFIPGPMNQSFDVIV